ncbi:LPS-assembly protein LptD [Tritonibacter horizontis]|uniref:LPS-assembly protein LptD n=1 Tax=Tritonibacter horizontis TaxID=1768241 RepID=A0A132BYE1_9RHOB|nr:LPS assembly protein LptD [Tritonibacter horizontis]KUP92740.1 LPS-assembly protein LptD precursor [Tritonibacter horizontis]
MPKTVNFTQTRRCSFFLAVLPLGLILAAGTPALAQSGATSRAGTASAEQPAETPAMLVADRVFVSPDRKLIAEGNVEAFQGDLRLQAARIVYDRQSGVLNIAGPIRIDQGDGQVTILADAAELDNGLRNGILRGARLVFEQQVQLAALQMTRVEGRYLQLYKTSVTSCDICENGGAPLWQIRAERITHDEQERQLYLEHAQLRIKDVPVFYFPALRLPDPTLDRASGFLIPSLSSSSNLGFGVKLPYFITVGPHRDLTVTPYISAKTRTLDLRYRQAFRTGQIEVTGAFSRDDIQPNDGRGYLFAEGTFELKRDYRLNFDLRTVSDNAYLADYDISDTDRLRSEVSVSRVRRDQLIELSAYDFKSLRDTENQDFVPATSLRGTIEQRLFPKRIGGELRLALDMARFNRGSSLNATATEANGRDVTRISTDITWLRGWVLPWGVETSVIAGLGLDSFALSDDAVFDNEANRATPKAAVTFRRPMQRQTASGAVQMLEPIVQLGWTHISGDDVPNESSNISEFDQGNLLALSRFPEADAREDGFALVYGASFGHFAPSGWEATATVAQILRSATQPGFTSSSGLDGRNSNVLIAGQIGLGSTMTLTARGLFDEEWSVSKAEFRGNITRDRMSLAGSYLWLQEDAAEERDTETSELWVDGSYALSPTWEIGADMRYDITDERATRAGLGLTYRNECVTLNLSLSRRYTSTTSVEPSTDFGFTLSLNGFSVKSDTTTSRRSCTTT